MGWADLSDDLDYDEPNELGKSTCVSKNAPPTKLVEVTDETAALKEKCSKRLELKAMII